MNEMSDWCISTPNGGMTMVWGQVRPNVFMRLFLRLIGLDVRFVELEETERDAAFIFRNRRYAKIFITGMKGEK